MNELVHFKSIEYHRIIPPQKNDSVLKGLSPKVKLRDITNSWPLKLLNESFAQWSYDTVCCAISYIKKAYAAKDLEKIIGVLEQDYAGPPGSDGMDKNKDAAPGRITG